MDFLRSGIFKVVVTGAVLGFAWVFFNQAISPLRARELESVAQLAALQERIDTANGEIREARRFAREAAREGAAIKQLAGDNRAASNLETFSARLKEYFSNAGFSVTVVRLNTIQDAADLPGYRRVYWSLGLAIPAAEQSVEASLRTVASLGDLDPLTKVVDFVLQTNPEDPQVRTLSVNIVALIEK